MPQPVPSRRAQAASAVNRESTFRDPARQRQDTERRIRQVAAWLRSFRTRRSPTP
jgi:hypothetical protein